MTARIRRVMVDAYILEVLMRDLTAHDKQPSAFLVYLDLWRRTSSVRTRRVTVSHQAMADSTGLSKSAVQMAVRTLRRRRLVQCWSASRTAVPEYTVQRPWAKPRIRESARLAISRP